MEQINLNSNVFLPIMQHQASDSIGNQSYYIGDFSYWYPNVIKEFYPIYYPVYQTFPNKFEQAFKIVMKLIEKKLIKIEKVQDFAEIINAIVDIL